MHFQTNQHLTVPPSRPSLSLLWSCFTPLLILMSLAGLASCGPASSDNSPNSVSRASRTEAALSKQSSSPSNKLMTPVTQAASSLPIASGSETSSASGKGTVPVGDSPHATHISAKPAVLEPLVVPAWIAKDLESPDVGTRLRALDKGVQTAPPGADDPLILALENKDERVRARAMELIEQNWARAADAEQ